MDFKFFCTDQLSSRIGLGCWGGWRSERVHRTTKLKVGETKKRKVYSIYVFTRSQRAQAATVPGFLEEQAPLGARNVKPLCGPVDSKVGKKNEKREIANRAASGRRLGIMDSRALHSSGRADPPDVGPKPSEVSSE